MSDSIEIFDWKTEYDKRMKAVNDSIWTTKPKTITKTKVVDKKVSESLYNIHKRSLPVGLDKPIAFNLTEKEADNWIKDYTHTQLTKVRGGDVKMVIYFDKVKQDEQSHTVYENNKSFASSEPVTILDNQENDIKWEG